MLVILDILLTFSAVLVKWHCLLVSVHLVNLFVYRQARLTMPYEHGRTDSIFKKSADRRICSTFRRSIDQNNYQSCSKVGDFVVWNIVLNASFHVIGFWRCMHTFFFRNSALGVLNRGNFVFVITLFTTLAMLTLLDGPLWSLLNFVLPFVFGSYWYFQSGHTKALSFFYKV